MLRPYVTVVAQVDTSGRVTDAQIDDSSGDPAFDAQGVAAMKQWTFLPASANCKAVAGTAEYVVSWGDLKLADPCEHDMVVMEAVTPEYPDAAREKGLRATQVIVSASTDAVGRLVKLVVTKSGGDPSLDAASFNAARQSNYFPAVHHCLPSAGTYQFKVTFDPNG